MLFTTFKQASTTTTSLIIITLAIQLNFTQIKIKLQERLS